MDTKKILITLSLGLGLVAAGAGIVLAEESTNTLTPTTTTTTIRKDAPRQATTASPEMISLLKTKADAEIARRIASINELIIKINGLKRLLGSDKTNLINTANTMVANLTALKTKIDADTDLATLRTDQKSIFDQYRIYMLFMPQLRIYVAADRINDTADLMTQVASKLQTRINGNTTLQATLDDANAKIADAKAQATNAINAISGLTPDSGNEGIASSNKQALLSAKDMIMAATTDLQTARHDFVSIVTTLKESKSPTPISTP